MSFGDTYIQLFNTSRSALKAVSPRLRVGGPATMELRSVAEFLAAFPDADFASTHTYPTDYCNSDPANLNCFTDGIVAAKKQAKDTPFLITEYSCGWKNSAIHGGESTSYSASFALRTVAALADAGLEALSWWTFSMLFVKC